MPEYRIDIDGSGSAFAASSEEPLLRSALRAGVGFPYECNSGSCGSCKFELLAGEVDAPAELTAGTNARDRQRKRYLACQVKASSDCRVKVRTSEAFVPLHRPRTMRARLAQRIAHTPDLTEFVFRTEEPARFLSGQYVLLQLPGLPGWRAYSMSNLANEEGQWCFFIKRVPGGAVTERLFAADDTVIEAVTIDGPFGCAYARLDIDRDAVCIGGGSGISPMLGVARSLAASGALRQRKLSFYYGCRTVADQLDPSLIGALASQVGSLTHSTVLSDLGAAATASWAGPTGFVHERVAEQLGADGDGAAREYYVCGPPPMVDAVVRMLVLDKKVPVEQIHYDRFF